MDKIQKRTHQKPLLSLADVAKTEGEFGQGLKNGVK